MRKFGESLITWFFSYRDANGMTTYQLAEKIGKRKLIAHLKNLRKEYPDRYDYAKAGVRLFLNLWLFRFLQIRC